MEKKTVNEYAKFIQKTPSNIYQKIKKGELKTVEENGKTYILFEKKEDEIFSNEREKFYKKQIKILEELVKSKDSEIETLKISLAVFQSFFSKQIEKKDEKSIIEVEAIQEKKKKKKRKKR